MASCYLIRYGLMGRVGRFWSETDDHVRGEAVVIRSHRGTELGEVLVAAPPSPEIAPALPASARILRAAGPDDLERARLAESDRAARFETCRRVFRDDVWPLELIDVEPLLDDRRTVLHYLGPHRLDTAGLLAAFRSACDLDVMLEPVGRDIVDEEEPHADEAHGCGDGCGTGGGCGEGGCGSHGGCSDCGVKRLLESHRSVIAR
jgi:cell fate regulator YaaT (PSP1 superfamily)